MRTSLICGGALVCAALLGFGLGAVKWRGSAQEFHRQARLAAIVDQAHQMPAGGVLVIGDSTAERARFESLCGRPALNAGISWSTPADWLPDARNVIDAARPSLVILAVGSNRDADWRRSFRTLAHLSGARLAVAPRDSETSAYISTILPVARGADEYQDAKHPSIAGYAQWSASINAACARLSL